MKRCIALWLLPACLSVGCLGDSFLTPPPPPPPPATMPPRPAPPVTVDQVEADNAHQIADKLRRELEREDP